MRSPRRRSVLPGFLALTALAAASPAGAVTISTSTLNGANERPNPVSTGATGSGSVTLNDAEDSVAIVLSWTGLSSNAFLAHIHGPAGVNATAPPIIDLTTLLPAAPNQTGTLTVSPASVTVTPSQVADLKAGLWYFNLHSVEFPGGEIRGQIVPEPGTTLLVTAGLAGLAWMGRRRRVS